MSPGESPFSNSEPARSPPPYGWASIAFGVISLVILPIEQLRFDAEGRLYGSVIAAILATVGVGFGIRGLRVGASPFFVSVIGLCGNSSIVALVVSRLVRSL